MRARMALGPTETGIQWITGPNASENGTITWQYKVYLTNVRYFANIFNKMPLLWKRENKNTDRI
jgi:hypothetical protein